MTNLELVRRSLALLAAGQPGSPWLDMEAEAGLAISYMFQRLAEVVAEDREKSGLLMQDYSVTLSSGVGTPLSATGSISATSGDLLYGHIPKGQVKDADANILLFVPQYSEFQGYVMPGFKYYTLVNQRIYARSAVSGDYSSDLGDVVGPLVITTNFVPTVTTLPAELENEAVQMLAQVLVEKYPRNPAGDPPTSERG